MTNYRKTILEAYQEVRERELSPKELKDREKIAKKLPIKDFEKRYGKEKGMQVKMATATNMAKKEEIVIDKELEKLSEKFTKIDPKVVDKVKTMLKDPKQKSSLKMIMKHMMPKDVVKMLHKEVPATKQLSEDGHTDVPSSIRKCKTMIEDASEIMSKLNTMGMEDNLPSWWTSKLAVASNSMNKLRDYILNPVQENVIHEAPGDLEDMKKMVDELKKASEMHLGQSKRVQAHIGMMEGEK